MHDKDGRHSNEDGHRDDEDGRHAGKETNLFWDIQTCTDFRLLQAILWEFSFFTMSGFLLSDNKKTVFFHFPPTSFYRLLINSEPKGKNVKHEWFGILFQIENRPNKGYCLFCQSQNHVLSYFDISGLIIENLFISFNRKRVKGYRMGLRLKEWRIIFGKRITRQFPLLLFLIPPIPRSTESVCFLPVLPWQSPKTDRWRPALFSNQKDISSS